MPERRIGLLWVMFLAYFAFGMITNVLGVIIPEAIKQYSLTNFEGGLLAFSFFVAYFFFSIPTGLLLDRLGAQAAPARCAGAWHGAEGHAGGFS